MYLKVRNGWTRRIISTGRLRSRGRASWRPWRRRRSGRGGDYYRNWPSGRWRCPRPCAECYSSIGWCCAVAAVGSDQSRSVSRSTPSAGGELGNASGRELQRRPWLGPLERVHAKRFLECARVPTVSKEDAAELGSAESTRGWTLEEFGRLVRKCCDLALQARAARSETYDRDPIMMMCDLSGRLFDVPPETLTRKLPERQPPRITPPQARDCHSARLPVEKRDACAKLARP